MSAKEAFEEYKTELNKHDFERLVPFISEECVFWHPTGVYNGLEQVRQGLEKGWQTILGKDCQFSKADWTVETDRMAICNYTFFYSGIVGDQKMVAPIYPCPVVNLLALNPLQIQLHLPYLLQTSNYQVTRNQQESFAS